MRPDHFPSSYGRRLCSAIPPPEWPRIHSEVAAAGRERRVLFYPSENRPRSIDIVLRPWLLTEAQRRYCQRLFWQIERATLRLPALWRSQPGVRELLPFTPAAAAFLGEYLTSEVLPRQTLFGRVDAAFRLSASDWRPTLRLLETNMVGLGAVYYADTAARIVQEFIAPRLAGIDPSLRLRPDDSFVHLLIDSAVAHAGKIGRGRRAHICFIEDKSARLGPDEFETMSLILNREGYRTWTADPGELEVHADEVCLRGVPMDVLYRDPTLNDLIEMERGGRDLTAVRLAFRRNQVVSGLAGEFDQKGALELFSSPAWLKFFPAAARRWFTRHVAWTRVIRETRTSPPGRTREVDLVPFLRRHRERLLVKPNVDYGGHGIVFGSDATAAEWDRALDSALRRPGSMVAQTHVPAWEDVYPVVRDGRVRFESFLHVTGFTATKKGIAYLARVAKGRVVNITGDAGVAGVLVARRKSRVGSPSP